MKPNVERLEAVLGSPDDREEVVVRVFTKSSGVEVAELSFDSGGLAIEWFQRQDGLQPVFNADDLVEIIARAKKRLVGGD